MNRGIKLFLIELVVCFLAAIGMNGSAIDHDMFTALGLINIIVSVINLLGGLIVYATGDKKNGAAICLAGGLLLLVGLGACSVFPFRMNH